MDASPRRKRRNRKSSPCPLSHKKKKPRHDSQVAKVDVLLMVLPLLVDDLGRSSIPILAQIQKSFATRFKTLALSAQPRWVMDTSRRCWEFDESDPIQAPFRDYLLEEHCAKIWIRDWITMIEKTQIRPPSPRSIRAGEGDSKTHATPFQLTPISLPHFPVPLEFGTVWKVLVDGQWEIVETMEWNRDDVWAFRFYLKNGKGIFAGHPTVDAFLSDDMDHKVEAVYTHLKNWGQIDVWCNKILSSADLFVHKPGTKVHMERNGVSLGCDPTRSSTRWIQHLVNVNPRSRSNFDQLYGPHGRILKKMNEYEEHMAHMRRQGHPGRQYRTLSEDEISGIVDCYACGGEDAEEWTIALKMLVAKLQLHPIVD